MGVSKPIPYGCKAIHHGLGATKNLFKYLFIMLSGAYFHRIRPVVIMQTGRL